MEHESSPKRVPKQEAAKTVENEPDSTHDNTNRYFLMVPYDPLYAGACITEPFTAIGHTIQWKCIDEMEYYLDSDLAEEFLTEIVKQQFKYFDDKEGHDTSNWLFSKILLGF